MKKLSQRQALLATTVLCGAALLGAGQASAQPAAPAAGADTEVVVTGSRIPRRALESVSAVTVVSDREIKAEGVVNVETLLNNLPSVFAGQNAAVSNGSTGTATVDLRGLGPSRTLVLIDGRRLQAGDPGDPVPDLNFIPSALVDRVDVLTGGASSVYGADAVAGVVNFIMKRDFEGIQIDTQYNFDQHSNDNGQAAAYLAADGITKPGDISEWNSNTTSIVIGANTPDHQGNVTAYAQYTHLQPIVQSSRDYSACTVTDVTSASGVTNGAHGCAGSSNSAFGRINLLGAQPITVPPGLVPAPGHGVGQIGKSLTNFGAAPGTFDAYSGAAAFNYGPYNYFQRADERYSLGSFAHYEINDHFNVYSDAMMMDDHTIAQIAPSGFFQTSGTYYIPCNNAFLSGTQQTELGCGTSYEGGGANAPAGTPAGTIASTIGYRFVNAAPRQDDLRHTDYRVVLGTKGDIVDGWTYDVYGQYGEAVYNEHYLNDVSDSKLQNALNTVSTTQCVVGGACVPINIFSSAGPSAAALAYVLTPGFKTGSTTEQIVEADVTGDLGKYGVKSPFDADSVKVSLGVDYRREALEEVVDNEYATGDLSGSGGATPPAHGAFDTREAYFEVHAPLVSGQELVKSLDFDAGYRSSQYSDVGHTDTYKYALEYAPISDIKFRASFNHAVRAPNIDELYQPDTVGLYSGSDPCSTPTATVANPHPHPADTFAQCALSGVSLAQYGSILPCPANQCNQLGGGTQTLKPEDSDTKSFGVVLTPRFIRDLSITIDYYDIKVNNVIQGISPNVSLSECLAGVTSYCANVHRDAAGSLGSPTGYIIDVNTNTGYLSTKGIDVEVNYRLRLSDVGLAGAGSLSFNYIGTWTDDFITQPVTGGSTYDCAGLYGTVCGNPDPHWRSKLRVTWASPWNFDLSGQWRYIGGVKLDTNQSNPLLNNGYNDVVDNQLPAFNYFDLSGNWRVKNGFTIRGGVNNIFDKDPPIVALAAAPTGAGNGNTFPGVYDALGRTFFVGLTAKF